MVCVFLLYYHPRRRAKVIVYCEIKGCVRKSPELVPSAAKMWLTMPQRFDHITLHKSCTSKIEVCASPIILGHYDVTHTCHMDICSVPIYKILAQGFTSCFHLWDLYNIMPKANTSQLRLAYFLCCFGSWSVRTGSSGPGVHSNYYTDDNHLPVIEFLTCTCWHCTSLHLPIWPHSYRYRVSMGAKIFWHRCALLNTAVLIW